MAEALVYRVHRYLLLVNVLALIVATIFLGVELLDIGFVLFMLGSIGLFLLAYLGEERSYMGTVVFGAVQTLFSIVLLLTHQTLIGFGLTASFGIALLIVALLVTSRYTKAKSKKALADFVPPAFG
jgi:hypothetical protein